MLVVLSKELEGELRFVAVQVQENYARMPVLLGSEVLFNLQQRSVGKGQTLEV